MGVDVSPADGENQAVGAATGDHYARERTHLVGIVTPPVLGVGKPEENEPSRTYATQVKQRDDVSDPLESLLSKITSREAVIGVVGLGYVGLPVAVTFAEEGFRVIGVDLDAARVEEIEAGRSHLMDIGDDRIRPLRVTEQLRETSSMKNWPMQMPS